MSEASLNLPRIGGGERRKVQLALEPKLAAELDQYARAYEEAYGERAEIEALIPHMLAKFIASDRAFRRWQTGRSRSGVGPARGSTSDGLAAG